MKSRKNGIYDLTCKTEIETEMQGTRVQLSHPYMTTGKTIALTRRTFVGKVMSLTGFLTGQVH